jgi:microcystin-dependent protein
MAIRNYTNTASPTFLTDAVDDDDTTLNVPSTTGYPEVPFTLAIDRGSNDEEIVLATAKSSNTFTVERGYDNTPASSHDADSPVEHVSSAQDFQDANAHIFDTDRDDHTQYLTEERVLALDLSGATGVSASPLGAIVAFVGAEGDVPDKWHLCNGAAVSRATYAELFAICGETYGEGDGSSTFNLPDLRGRFPLGQSFNGRTLYATTMTLGGVSGEELHTLSVLELASHTHIQNPHIHEMPTHNHTGTTGHNGAHVHAELFGADWFLTITSNVNHEEYQKPAPGTGARAYPNSGGTPDGADIHNHTFSTNYTDPGDTVNATAVNQQSGGGWPHNNMPPYQVMNFIIRIEP